MNVLMVAHGHPSLHKGGGEVAAYSMFQMLRAAGHHAVFLGWSGHAESPTRGALQQIGEDDYLLYTRSEYFHFSSQSANLRNALETILATEEFDAVHLHHYIHVGIEAATLVKQLSPKTRVILTLHEYLAICANNGQLFTPKGTVCAGYAPDRCAVCFPDRNPAAFFMREIAVKSAFSFVDHFLSPSEFLRQQYIQWGIDPQRISAIENPLPLTPRSDGKGLAPPRRGAAWKIGFFGQINFYKGLDIFARWCHPSRCRWHRGTYRCAWQHVGSHWGGIY
jgi:glycosyltransferase involved in cell wall biosynthesis